MAIVPWIRKSSRRPARTASSRAWAAAARRLVIPQIRWHQPRRWLRKIQAEASTNFSERQRSGPLGIARSGPFLMGRRRDDLLDIGGLVTVSVVWFQVAYQW